MIGVSAQMLSELKYCGISVEILFAVSLDMFEYNCLVLNIHRCYSCLARHFMCTITSGEIVHSHRLPTVLSCN